MPASDHLASPASVRRLRTVETADELHRRPPRPQELRERAVVVRAGAAGDGDTLRTFLRLFPDLDVWTDHASYRTGVWSCVVDGSLAEPQYTAYEPAHLEFHTDMSRYHRPPEYTLIRCVEPDDGGGGENLVIHVDDVLEELLARGRDDIVEMLAAERPLDMELRHRNTADSRCADRVLAPLAVAGEPRSPARVFDRHAATKGLHLTLSDEDAARYDEFLEICNELDAATCRVTLQRGDVLAFSNWRFVHARGACAGSGRMTEIAMANASTP
jgi:alpha-ketoglutarate-dependent taurine dioxygenase